MSESDTLTITGWDGLKYPEKEFKSARISKFTKEPGYYLMEGIMGYLVYELKKSITITKLEIDDDEVMNDEPINWLGMKCIADACYGKVLIGGLGLGIILHHLLTNRKVTKIVVCEINRDVIELITSCLPDDLRVVILNENIFDISPKPYDIIVLDVLVKHGSHFKEDFPDMIDINSYIRRHHDKKIFVWGLNNKTLNPGYCPSEDVERRLEKLKEELKRRQET